jgi:hypothetical protein
MECQEKDRHHWVECKWMPTVQAVAARCSVDFDLLHLLLRCHLSRTVEAPGALSLDNVLEPPSVCLGGMISHRKQFGDDWIEALCEACSLHIH